MDQRISEDVRRMRDQALDHEYAVVEDVCGALPEPCRVVDIGCGSLGLLERMGTRLHQLYKGSLGIDIDRKGLARNRNVAHHVCASCYALPLRTGSVDVILCRWVFEHLEHPDQAMREFSRVLKKGGVLYVKTPNFWHYSMLVSWATSTWFHNVFRSATGQGENTPTFYRANTSRQLGRLAADTGFSVRRFEYYPFSFMYYSFNKELFVTMKFVSTLVRSITERAQQMLLCVFVKLEDR
jgi:SAM-dependent methyltransferase